MGWIYSFSNISTYYHAYSFGVNKSNLPIVEWSKYRGNESKMFSTHIIYSNDAFHSLTKNGKNQTSSSYSHLSS